MRSLTYFAVFEPSTDGGFGVYYPDLPGCISYGKNYKEAVKMAKEALELHIYGMEEDSDNLPNPNDPPELEIDDETSSGYIVAPITIYPDIAKNELDNKAVKTNVTIPAWLKYAAEKANAPFSQILQNALKEYLHIQTNS